MVDKIPDAEGLSFDSEMSQRTKRNFEKAQKAKINTESKSHMRMSHIMYGVKPIPIDNSPKIKAKK